MTTNSISNSDDVIDSRDVIDRIEELRDDLQQAWHDCLPRADDFDAADDWPLDTSEDCGRLPIAISGFVESGQIDGDDLDELKALLALAEEAEGYASDWSYGAQLIRDSYFTQYAQELAEDIGAIQDDAGWPGRHIDWHAAADALKVDYTMVDFDGVDYWVR